PEVLCVGAAAIDRVYSLLGETRLHTSNPADGHRGFGGVARNVAENLARLGLDVALASIVGVDRDGVLLRRHLQECGIDTSRLIVSDRHSTAEYVAILDTNQQLVLGASQMTIFDDFTIAHLQAALNNLSEDAWIFADCNLPSDVLELLFERRRQKLAVNAVSIEKVAHLPRDLAGAEIVFFNESEARAYIDAARIDEPLELAREIYRRGPGAVVVSCGAKGVSVASVGMLTRHPAAQTRIVDVTGAGDALVAGTLFARTEGKSLGEAVTIGARLAALTLETAGSVHQELSRAMLLG
ncbi:MAG: carbohydrate kinase family protein, partial [Polyangiaceae bacterium]